MGDTDGRSFIVGALRPGSFGFPVRQDTLLGFMGAYSGGSGQVSLHFYPSVVTDDGSGSFLDKTGIENTLDPSPYMGMPPNYACDARVLRCSVDPRCLR